jgi:hypothetical protein
MTNNITELRGGANWSSRQGALGLDRWGGGSPYARRRIASKKKAEAKLVCLSS